MNCDQIVLLRHQVTMVASEHLYQTIGLPRKHVTGSIHYYLFCYCPLSGYSIWGSENCLFMNFCKIMADHSISNKNSRWNDTQKYSKDKHITCLKMRPTITTNLIIYLSNLVGKKKPGNFDFDLMPSTSMADLSHYKCPAIWCVFCL